MPNNAIHHVKQDLVAEHRIVVLQLSGRQQRHELVHEDEEPKRQDRD